MHNKQMANQQKVLQEKLKQRLLELGLLTEITPPLHADKFPQGRQPIPLDGRQGSRLIIDERR